MPCAALRTLSSHAQELEPRAPGGGQAEISTKGKSALCGYNLPLKASPASRRALCSSTLREALLCARRNGKRIKEAQQDLFAIAQHGLDGLKTPALVLGFRHLCSRCCGRGVAGHRSGQRYLGRSGSSFSRLVPHQDQLSAHPSRVSSAYLQETFGAPVQTSAQCGGLKFKELCGHKKASWLQQRGTAQTLIVEEKAKSRLRYNQADKADKPKVAYCTITSENLRSFPNEIECEQCGLVPE